MAGLLVATTHRAQLMNILVNFIKKPLFHDIFLINVHIFPCIYHLNLSVNIHILIRNYLCVFVCVVSFDVTLIRSLRLNSLGFPTLTISNKMKRFI